MTKFSSGAQKILIIASFSMLLATIIISSITVNYIKQENIKAKAQSQRPPYQPVGEILKPGTVGEVSGNNNGVNTQLPQIVANVSGTIKEVKSDRLIIKGDGVNFEDNVSRDVTAIFTEQTLTIISASPENIKYDGLEGLKYLKVGDNILVEGAENLRGKTEFKVKIINIL